MTHNQYHQHNNYFYDSQGHLMNEMPGFQNFFIAAKKNAQLITDWKNQLIKYLPLNYYEIMQDILDKDIFLAKFGATCYHRAYFALYHVLQRKQIEMD